MSAPCVTVVVADSSVLINLIVTGRLALLGGLDGHRFVVPDEVVEELRWLGHSEAIAAAVQDGLVDQVAVDAIDSVDLTLALHATLGRGEMAGLAIALKNTWSITSTGNPRFHREILKRLGKDRLIETMRPSLAPPSAGRPPQGRVGQ